MNGKVVASLLGLYAQSQVARGSLRMGNYDSGYECEWRHEWECKEIIQHRHAIDGSYLEADGDSDDTEGEEDAAERKFDVLL